MLTAIRLGALAVVAAVATLSGCGFACPEQVLSTADAPDGVLSARGVLRGCGQEAAVIALLVDGKSKQETILLDTRRAGGVYVQWQSAQRLQVTLVDMRRDDAERAHRRALRRFRHVTIEYYLRNPDGVRSLS